MKLRTRLNLVLTGVTAIFLAVLVADEVRDARSSVREEIEAANRVAAQVIGSLILIYSAAGGTAVVQQMLQRLGHVRANDITLRDPAGRLLYHSPPPMYKAGREAPGWLRTCSRRSRSGRPSPWVTVRKWWSRRSPRAPSSMPGMTSRGCSPSPPSC